MIADVIAAVRAKMTERGIPAEVLDGLEHLPREGAGARVVWVETRDAFTAPQRSKGNPPTVLLRAAGADVHVWGVSTVEGATPEQHRAVTNALVHQVLVALHLVAGASSLGYEVDAGEWNNDAEMHFGAEYTFHAVIKVPVVDEPWPVVEGLTATNVSTIEIGEQQAFACGGGI